MNWLKDNLIMLLGGASALLVIGLVILLAQNKTLEAEKETLQVRYKTLETANAANAESARDSAERLTKLTEQHRLDLERADFLADELDKYKQRTNEEVVKNSRLRAELAAKNAVVKSYLDAGMPREVACLTWPESCE